MICSQIWWLFSVVLLEVTAEDAQPAAPLVCLPVDAEAMGSNGVDLAFSERLRRGGRAVIASGRSPACSHSRSGQLDLCGSSVGTYSPD
jgi:hypothetical protein